MADNINADVTRQEIQATLNASSPIININGTDDYNELTNKPQINSVELAGNKTFEELGDHILTNAEILELYRRA